MIFLKEQDYSGSEKPLKASVSSSLSKRDPLLDFVFLEKPHHPSQLVLVQ
jgi:hypothetical protein